MNRLLKIKKGSSETIVVVNYEQHGSKKSHSLFQYIVQDCESGKRMLLISHSNDSSQTTNTLPCKMLGDQYAKAHFWEPRMDTHRDGCLTVATPLQQINQGIITLILCCD